MAVVGWAIILIFIVALVWFIVWALYRDHKSYKDAVWTVHPLKKPDGSAEVWLEKVGEQDICWKRLPPGHSQTDWDTAKYEAEGEALELDRIQSIDRKG